MRRTPGRDADAHADDRLAHKMHSNCQNIVKGNRINGQSTRTAMWHVWAQLFKQKNGTTATEAWLMHDACRHTSVYTS